MAGASSKITCAFVPQKPKLLTPARLGMPLGSHGIRVLFTKNGLFAKSISGLGEVKCKVAGICRCRMARRILRLPAIPAAVVACPKLPLIDPMAQKRRLDVKVRCTRVRASSSMGSPMGVAVPWASTKLMVSGWMSPRPMAVAMTLAWPSTPGAR